jgi:hypothetical protein
MKLLLIASSHSLLQLNMLNILEDIRIMGLVWYVTEGKDSLSSEDF